MHMADALLSPAVGATFWAGTAAAGCLASKKLKDQTDDRMIPLMGVLGAFIFAAQMINFTIPGTGSSGHLGGGMILAVLLGPWAAFLVMASVLTVQALFFADGGLLALGCNIWNLAFYPSFLVYPFIYRPLAGRDNRPGRCLAAALVSAVAALQLGSFSVVLQTLFSGKSELPFGAFALMMQPIHLAIGIAEGLATAGVINYVANARPELLDRACGTGSTDRQLPLKKITVTFLILAIITGGGVSWFASTRPDGLEWSVGKVTGGKELAPQQEGIAAGIKAWQDKTALLPDYNFRRGERDATAETANPRRTGVDAGTSLSGILGGAFVLVMVLLIGMAVRFFRDRRT